MSRELRHAYDKVETVRGVQHVVRTLGLRLRPTSPSSRTRKEDSSFRGGLSGSLRKARRPKSRVGRILTPWPKILPPLLGDDGPTLFMRLLLRITL